MVIISAGNIFKQTFAVWFRNILVYLILSSIACVPLLIYAWSVLTGEFSLQKLVIFGPVLAFAALLLSPIITGMVSYSVFRTLRGDSTPLGTAVAAGLARLVPIVTTGIVVGIVVGLFFAPMIWGYTKGGNESSMLTLLMLIPGIYASIMLSLAVPAAAVEGLNAIAAVKRSYQLTQGSRGTIFGVLFLIGIIENILSRIVESVLLSGTPTLANIEAYMADVKVYLWVILGFSVLFMSLRGVAQAVAYHDIRTVREGLDSGDLASVFE